jgi:Co/Zn/Cd efflux system component
MSGCACELDEAADLERRTLRILLAINGAMFFGELIAGWIADSTSLVADSLDMLADASVYGIALYGVGRGRRHQANAASFAGGVEIMLGVGVLFEVLRRLLYGSEPVSVLMMTVGAVALVANTICLLLISKHREGGIHMRASWIFSANDVIANIGVILSGALVMILGSRFPDLVVGALISVIVTFGGVKILREAREAREVGETREAPVAPEAEAAGETDVVPSSGTECCFENCRTNGPPTLRLTISPPPDNAPVAVWSHAGCFARLRDPSVEPDDPADHGGIPAHVRCMFCGRSLPVFGKHPLVIDVGDHSPPQRFWSHAECAAERISVPEGST